MARTPGASLSTSEIVAGERSRYSPRIRRLIGWPGVGSGLDFDRLAIYLFVAPERYIPVIFSRRAVSGDKISTRGIAEISCRNCSGPGQMALRPPARSSRRLQRRLLNGLRVVR